MSAYCKEWDVYNLIFCTITFKKDILLFVIITFKCSLVIKEISI